MNRPPAAQSSGRGDAVRAHGAKDRAALFFVVALVLLFVLPSPWNLMGAVAGGALFILEIGYWQRRVRSQKVQTGIENLVGAAGEVTEPLGPTGQIRVLGELWEARAASELPRGTRVRVIAMDGLTLEVEPDEIAP
jgi:membrane protein implicated in regulation of membrane protease activity